MSETGLEGMGTNQYLQEIDQMLDDVESKIPMGQKAARILHHTSVEYLADTGELRRAIYDKAVTRVNSPHDETQIAQVTAAKGLLEKIRLGELPQPPAKEISLIPEIGDSVRGAKFQSNPEKN